MPIRFGAFVPQGRLLDLIEIDGAEAKYEALTHVAKVIDTIAGFDSIWLSDHVHTGPKVIRESVFECWTTTAALARDTQRVHIGQMVTCVGFRNPALLAKMASTVDVMSHGRLYCGIGAGWDAAEWSAYGYDFPPTAKRMAAFDEAAQIMRRLWAEPQAAFEGRHYRVCQAFNEPKGAGDTPPSLWIGGGGEQVTLRMVAQYGDACNLTGSPEQLRHKLAVLRQHCQHHDRDYDSITRSANVNIVLLPAGADPEAATAQIRAPFGWTYEQLCQALIVGTAEQVTRRLQEIVDVGIDYIIAYFPRVAYTHDALYEFAEAVIPALQGAIANEGRYGAR